jgi:glutathione S-transferase
MSLKLYAFPPSPRGFKVVLAAQHLKMDYELHRVDLTRGEQNAPAFAALNPNKRMPVLEEDGFVLWESNAILEYLASKAPESGFYPRETRARLSVTKWLYWESNHWDPACAILVSERIVKPFFGGGESSATEIARGETLFNRLAPVLDGELTRHRFVAGDELTLADLAIGASFVTADQALYPLEPYRAIRRWHVELKSLPAWSEAVALQQRPPA